MDNGFQLADRHRIQQVQMTAPIQALLAEAWRRTIDPNRLDATFPRYLAAAEVILGMGRRTSHELARQYYLSLAAGAGSKAAAATVAAGLAVAPLNRPAVATSLRVVGPVLVKARLAQGVPLERAMREGLAATVAAGKRITLEGGREMLVQASRRDPNVLAWARVSDGSPCHFCAMLVSRGPVYGEDTVAFRAHDGCGCGVRLVYRADSDKGWSDNATALRRLWDETGDLSSFRSALRDARKDGALSDSADVSRETRAA